MGLFFQKDLEEIQKLNFQLQNLWTFDIYSAFSTPPPALFQGKSIFPPSDFNNTIRFRIQSINLPRFKLEMDRLNNGDLYYSGFTFEDNVSITIFETVDMASYKYFNDWMNVIFDRKSMRFNVIDEFYNPKNMAFRKGVLSLYNYEANWSIIAGTLFNSTIRNIVEPTLRSKIKVPKTTNSLAQNFVNTAFAGTSILAGENINNISNNLIPQVSKKTSGKFIFNNMKIKSIEDTNFSYDNGDPLILNLNFEVESVTFEEGNNLTVN